jgi:hypothetical protein
MDRIITIEKGDPATKTLTLSDKGTTNAIPGDQVTWKIASGSGVAAIVAIKNKPISVDVFNPDPHALNNGTTDWQGTVHPGITVPEGGLTEQYSITWNSTGGGWHGQGIGGIVTDPRIKVNPK